MPNVTVENINQVPAKVFDVHSGTKIVAVSAESLNLVLNVKDAAGSTVVVGTAYRPIASMEGAMIGSFWRNPENLVWDSGYPQYAASAGIPGNTSKLLSVTTTATSAACVINDASYDLEKLFESATTCRYVVVVEDTTGQTLYGWVGGIAKSTNTYTLTVYNNVTIATGTQDWMNTAAITFGTVRSFKIYKYTSSIVWGSTDTFTEEVKYREDVSDLDILRSLSNGQYAIDYLNGRVLARKANDDNTETVSYSYLSPSIIADLGEFPAAATITDNFATPTTTSVMAMGMVYDGSAWDMLRGDATNGMLVNLGTNNDVAVTSVIPLTGATNLGKAIDTAVGGTDTGVAALVKRTDSLAGLTPADGDYTVLNVDSQGMLWTRLGSPASLSSTKSDDGAFSVGTDQVFPIGCLFDDVAPDSVDEGDIGLPRMSANRVQYAQIRDAAGNERGLNVDANGEIGIGAIRTSVTPGTAAANLGKAIDSAQGGTDTGVASLVIRKDALAGLTPADGDYTVLQVNNQGALWVAVSSPVNLSQMKSDDGAFTIGVDNVMPMGALADETATDSVDEGDIGLPRMSLDRVLWNRMHPAGTSTLSNVNDAATNTALSAANTARKGWYVHNDSTSILYINFGGTASTTAYTVKVQPDGYYEMPLPVYTGAINGIWSADSTGAARITELT